MTERQPGTRRWGRGGNNDPSFMVNKQREQDVSKITAELILKSGSSDKALNRTMDIIGDIQKAAAKGIDLKIGKDATITEMMQLRHELIEQLDITGKQADRILHAIFGKEYKLRADPKPMSKAAMQAQAQVQHLQDKLRDVDNMKVTPSVVVQTSGTEQLGYIKSMIDGIKSKTVTLNILKDYGYTGPDQPQAYGGSYVLNRATRFLAGESSREIAAFIPLNSPTRALQIYDQLTAQLAPYLPAPKTTSAGRGSAGASSATSAGGASPVIYAGPQTVEVPVYLDGELIAYQVLDIADTLGDRSGRGEA